MDTFLFLKKPISYIYLVSGYLSLNGFIYNLIYKIKNIKDEDNSQSSIIIKTRIIINYILIRLFLLLLFSFSLTFIELNKAIIVISSAIIYFHIIYLLIWQIAYFFDLSKYIDDISRNDFYTSEQLFFSLINFLEIIICFSILFYFIFDSFNILYHTHISHIYFSFVNITTLGFGDIIPTTSYSQLLTITETMIGFVYLVINLPILITNTHKDK